ncbi:hypothetical protein ACRYCC_07675 [Actinomadura scrupuli]
MTASAKVTAICGAAITLAGATDDFLSTHQVANRNTVRPQSLNAQVQ